MDPSPELIARFTQAQEEYLDVEVELRSYIYGYPMGKLGVMGATCDLSEAHVQRYVRLKEEALWRLASLKVADAIGVSLDER